MADNKFINKTQFKEALNNLLDASKLDKSEIMTKSLGADDTDIFLYGEDSLGNVVKIRVSDLTKDVKTVNAIMSESNGRVFDCAERHNKLIRGKNLGERPSREQLEAIRDGSFHDIYIGDYWLNDGMFYLVAGLNHFKYDDDVYGTSKNHVVVLIVRMKNFRHLNHSYDNVQYLFENSSPPSGGIRRFDETDLYTKGYPLYVEQIKAKFSNNLIPFKREFGSLSRYELIGKPKYADTYFKINTVYIDTLTISDITDYNEDVAASYKAPQGSIYNNRFITTTTSKGGVIDGYYLSNGFFNALPIFKYGISANSYTSRNIILEAYNRTIDSTSGSVEYNTRTPLPYRGSDNSNIQQFLRFRTATYQGIELSVDTDYFENAAIGDGRLFPYIFCIG